MVEGFGRTPWHREDHVQWYVELLGAMDMGHTWRAGISWLALKHSCSSELLLYRLLSRGT